jgi:hypothetical protein
VHLSETNGIRTLWTDGPAPYSAALVFGVGGRDETLRTAGVTHLVEHLVMGSLPKRALDRNANVDAMATIFHATGSRDDVTEFIAGVCAALRELPLERLATEQKVLDAEQGHHEHPALGWAASTLHGAEGVGLIGLDGPPAGEIGAEHVVSHVRSWFTADNAVLVCTGPPPTHPAIALHPGTPPEHPPTHDHGPTRPAVIAGVPDVIIATHGSTELPMLVGFNLVRERLEDEARHSLGLSYEIGLDYVLTGEDESLYAIWCDAAPEHHEKVATIAVEALRSLAEDGPNAEELDFARASLSASARDPRAVLDHLIFGARRMLRGLPAPTVDELVAQSDAVTSEDVQRHSRAAAQNLLIGVAEPMARGIAGIPDRSEDPMADGPVVEGETFSRKLTAFGAPRDLKVVVGADGISVTFKGQRNGGPWSDVVGVAVDGENRVVVMRDGRLMPVIAGALRGGDRAVAAIDEYAGAVRYAQPGVLDD